MVPFTVQRTLLLSILTLKYRQVKKNLPMDGMLIQRMYMTGLLMISETPIIMTLKGTTITLINLEPHGFRMLALMSGMVKLKLVISGITMTLIIRSIGTPRETFG